MSTVHTLMKIKHKRHRKVHNILSKIQSPKQTTFIEKVLVCPIQIEIRDLIKSKVVFNNNDDDEQTNSNTKTIIQDKNNLIVNQEIILYGDILLYKFNPLYKPIMIPRYQLLDFTASVSNANFINKHMHNVVFFYSPIIKMSFYEVLFDYLEWRCLLYSVSVHLPSQISICLTKEKLYIYTYIKPEMCIISLSNLIHTWLDALHIVQIKEPKKCTSLQKCTLHITSEDYKMRILLTTVPPLYIESDLEILEEQFKLSTLPLLAHRCSVLSEVSNMLFLILCAYYNLISPRIYSESFNPRFCNQHI